MKWQQNTTKETMNPLVVNIIGGPGAGKSTTAASVFAKLKWAGVNCEMALEFAKDKVWENSLDVLEDQVYILGKQHHRLFRLKDKVDVVITDSPLILSLIYGHHMGDNFSMLALELFAKYDNITYLLQREKAYNPKGRVQTEEKAKDLDKEIMKVMDYHQIPYVTLPGNPTTAEIIANQVLVALDMVQ